MIIIIDKFLNNEECKSIIDYFDNSELPRKWTTNQVPIMKEITPLFRQTFRKKYNMEFPLSRIPKYKRTHPNNQKTVHTYAVETSTILKESTDFTKFYSKIIDRIESTIQKYYENDIEHEWSLLKRNDIDNHHGNHYDTASPDTVLSSILYLNKDFRGGQTFLRAGKQSNKTSVCPEIGRLLLFDGMKYEHGATVNSNFYRYTIAGWWKLKKA